MNLSASYLNYQENLRLLQTTFFAGSEGDAIAESIKTYCDRKAVNVLDVGCGNGKFLRRTYEILTQAGIEATLTGIDPDSSNVEEATRQLPASKIYCTDFEHFVTDGKLYDVITARHTLYYVQELNQQLNRMIELLNPGGLLAIVLWSKRCDLYRAHLTVAGDGSPIPTAGTIKKIFRARFDVQPVSKKTYLGSVDIAAWRNSEEICRSAYFILGRQAITSIPTDSLQRFREKLGSFPDVGQRQVTVLVYKKQSKNT